MLQPLKEVILKILFSGQGHLLASCKIEREKFYPVPGIEPGPLALRTSALPLRHPGQLPIQGRINLFVPILSDLRTTTNLVVFTSYRGMHSYI